MTIGILFQGASPAIPCRMRHVLDAICYMRINLRESARSVRERLRDTESARGSCERAARVREACEKNFARNLQGLRSWFKLQEIWYDHDIIVAVKPVYKLNY
jgi:hypothetical protein